MSNERCEFGVQIIERVTGWKGAQWDLDGMGYGTNGDLATVLRDADKVAASFQKNARNGSVFRAVVSRFCTPCIDGTSKRTKAGTHAGPGRAIYRRRHCKFCNDTQRLEVPAAELDAARAAGVAA